MESAPTSGFHRLTYRVKKFKTIKKKKKKTKTTINSRNISFTGQILDVRENCYHLIYELSMSILCII